jgi:Insect cuticle protein
MIILIRMQVSVMSGSYSYIGADGLTYVVDWYADETGFHPTAPHLPKVQTVQ